MPAWIPNWGWCKPKHKRIVDAELRARQALQARVDELTTERDNLSTELGHALDKIEVLEAEHAEYRAVIEHFHEVSHNLLHGCGDDEDYHLEPVEDE